mmetsp:Transcript_30318/g.45215  ORF Transcript_30318/g.45215 Transcript_30318/m.45215 type:complete len:98 (+) Transcript_30318:36-329(+)
MRWKVPLPVGVMHQLLLRKQQLGLPNPLASTGGEASILSETESGCLSHTVQCVCFLFHAAASISYLNQTVLLLKMEKGTGERASLGLRSQLQLRKAP